MHLLDSELKNKEQWEKAEISLPQFDRQAMKEETKKNPQWVHFGAGNIFRAFPAALQQKLLNEAIILKSLHNANDKTIVLISHRKSTLAIADNIYSMESGRNS